MEPKIESSTEEQRMAYISETFRCRSDCNICGICQVFHGKEPLLIFEDYIAGRRTFQEIFREYKRVK